MRLFTDQNVYALTVSFLRAKGHDVETAREAGLQTAEDQRILDHCVRNGRTLVTRDKDFGNLIFSRGMPYPGVILVRCGPLLLDHAHHQLRNALETISSLEGIFLVIEESRYRVRKA